MDESKWSSIDGALTYKRTIYVPVAFGSKVTSLFDNNPGSGHSRVLTTGKLGSQDLEWPEMKSEIWMYVAGYDLCHLIQAAHHSSNELDMPLSPTFHPSKGLTMDTITNIPVSAGSEYTAILINVDHLPKMVTYFPWRKDIDSPEIARMCFKHMILK